MASSEANADEAAKCVQLARRALAAGDVAKAERLAQKAQAMHPSIELGGLLSQVRAAKGGPTVPESQQGPGHQAPPEANGHASSSHHRSAGRDGPAGMSHSNLHQRKGAGGAGHGGSRTQPARAVPEPQVEDPGTPDQRKLVSEILASKDLYHILGLSKTASDDDIRKAYRKLALKLHPDKNRAHRADEAFKAVGRAFACLSDPDKRAYYDRTGFESSAAQVAAQAASRQATGGYATRGGAGVYETADFDPDEIFNMFFGGMAPGARVFRAQFGGRPPPRRHTGTASAGSGGADEMQRMLLSLLQFLPILLLVLLSLFAASQKAPFSLLRDHNHYPEEVRTTRLEVPFFVKSVLEFDRQYPRGSSGRLKVERQVEGDYYERQQQRCHTEKLTKQRMWAYGNREEANRMVMAACDEVDRMNQKLGLRSSYPWR